MYRRHQAVAVGARRAALSSRASFSTTASRLQLQGRDDLLSRHGAGFVQPQSMASVPRETLDRLPFLTAAAAPADLQRTRLHEGLGTSAKDPYFRTLPNVPSEAPESSVLDSAKNVMPNLEEIASLGKRSAKMQYWLGDRAPRLPLYLRSLVVQQELPVSAKAEQLVRDFASHFLPSLPADAREKVGALWAKASKQYKAVAELCVLDRRQFETELAKLHGDTVAEAEAVGNGADQIKLALEVLRRKAVIDRNTILRDDFLQQVENASYLGFGDSVWRIFFSAVEKFKPAILGKPENKLLAYVWESLMLQDDLRTPALTAPVALYLTLLATHVSPSLVSEESREKSRLLDSGLRATRDNSSSSTHDLGLLPPLTKRRFAAQAVRALLATPEGCKALADELRRHGHRELAQEVLLCEAMCNDTELRRADVEDVLPLFENPAEVSSLLASIVGDSDAVAKADVLRTFHAPKSDRQDWAQLLRSVEWEANWRSLVVTLLSSDAVLAAVCKHVKNNINAKGTDVKVLFSSDAREQLEQVSKLRQARQQTRRDKIAHVAAELGSFALADEALGMLRAVGADMSAIDAEAAALLDDLRLPRRQVANTTLETALYAVCQRHPNWIKAGVLSGNQSLQSPTDAVEKMLRMFVRLTYVPQSGAAAIAHHTRRRIGPVGTEPTQFNIPGEMGVVEQFDNLQYKRYDWQGWYQRMVDVHNRNVSVRCRLDDLKRLDGGGNPFVDLQTERRLRIIAKDRVGMGVVKLDSDKYEDQHDNVTYGVGKLSELLAESRKAQLGQEYWPTVEVKVRRPSGRSQAHYSLIDHDRIEKRSAELYAKYRDAKKRSLFVTPMDLWLEVKGMQTRKATDNTDEHGYTIENLSSALEDDEKPN